VWSAVTWFEVGEPPTSEGAIGAPLRGAPGDPKLACGCGIADLTAGRHGFDELTNSGSQSLSRDRLEKRCNNAVDDLVIGDRRDNAPTRVARALLLVEKGRGGDEGEKLGHIAPQPHLLRGEVRD
jgi:hypothetical protein